MLSLTYSSGPHSSFAFSFHTREISLWPAPPFTHFMLSDRIRPTLIYPQKSQIQRHSCIQDPHPQFCCLHFLQNRNVLISHHRSPVYGTEPSVNPHLDLKFLNPLTAAQILRLFHTGCFPAYLTGISYPLRTASTSRNISPEPPRAPDISPLCRSAPHDFPVG